MLADSKFTVPLVSLATDTMVYPSGAVIGSSRDHELINVGNFVQFSAGPEEVTREVLYWCDNRHSTMMLIINLCTFCVG